MNLLGILLEVATESVIYWNVQSVLWEAFGEEMCTLYLSKYVVLLTALIYV